ncbi:unnamed protein product [Ectocarpus sp. CCAP 1310/34]|nr:unnamed protein product [Ectocarpus sp. CCAP 1310/34]
MLLANGSAQSNTSCVQVVDSSAADASPYPEDEPSLTFTMEGATTLRTNIVNVVIVVDGSGSIVSSDWILEQQFAKDTVAAFARRNIFDNGGTASYVQFSTSTYDEGTFTSTESFDEHVDSVIQWGGDTDIADGIIAGRALLNENPASFSFMVLITDGESYTDPSTAAQETRADNTTTIFAVGVGSQISTETLLDIAGEESNVFSVTNFSSLEAAVEDIEVIADQTVLSCPATNVSITVEFDVPVLSVVSSDAAITGNRVTFAADNLENNPTQFAVGLLDCGLVISVDYEDEQENVPDLSILPDPTCPAEGSRSGVRAAHFATFVVVSTVIASIIANLIGGDTNSSSTETAKIPVDPKPSSSSRNQGEQGSVVTDVPDRQLADNAASASLGDARAQDSSEGGAEVVTGAANIKLVDNTTSAGFGDAPAQDSNERGAVDGTYGRPAEDAAAVGLEGATAVGRNEQTVLLAAGILASVRRPSSALVVLLIVQIQFLAILSLVDSVGSERSWLSDFLEFLRWINLWLRIGADSDDTYAEKNNDIDEEGFLGNLVLFLCLFFLILVVHLLLVSAIEAWWLQRKKRDDLQEVRAAFEEGGVQQAALADGPPPQRPPPSYEQVAIKPDGQAASVDGPLPQGPPPSYDKVATKPDGAADDVNVGAEGTRSAGGEEAGDDGLGPVAKCRDRSKSLWIHFPHVELLFILYAFQGALAAQVDVLRHGSGALVPVAAIALVVYPVLVLWVMVRVVFARVFPPTATGLAFAVTQKDSYYTTNGQRGCRGFFWRVRKGLEEDHSAFAWAKKGAWRTVENEDAKEQRLRNWFRIGFEPLFVDYTKAGSWFALYALMEAAVIACVGVLIDSSQVQLLIFLGLNVVQFVLVAHLTPFANRVVESMAACRVGVNAFCMVLLVGAEAEGDSVHAERMETAVGCFELILLIALAIPVYVDTGMVFGAAIYSRIRKIAANRAARNDQTQTTGVTRPCIPEGWGATWCKMIARNAAAYAGDVTNGLRRKPHSA